MDKIMYEAALLIKNGDYLSLSICFCMNVEQYVQINFHQKTHDSKLYVHGCFISIF